jgi:putative FmdB family regulatory protein
MPLYEYKCSACGHRFERIVKFSDAPLKTCPACGKDALEQLIHAPAVQFKGSGWYVSDYARKGSNPASSKPVSGGSESVSSSKDAGAKESASPSAEKTAGDSGTGGAKPDPSKGKGK